MPRKPGSLTPMQMERGRAIAKLRMEQLTWAEIGEKLGIHRTTTQKIFVSYLSATSATDISTARRWEAHKLDKLESALWETAMDKANRRQVWAVDRLLAIQERRARLLGLDAPLRQTVTVVTEDTVDAEIARLQSELRERSGRQVGAIEGTSTEGREAAAV